ncbi:MAG: hypothetical protein J6C42_04780 [Clostridia bacterium]|nr:hypothetical protein [Clostridia bacterium]
MTVIRSPDIGCGNSVFQECSAWRRMYGEPVPYSESPVTGQPIPANCTRIWCVRPVMDEWNVY